jgi:periplasmic protein TonB
MRSFFVRLRTGLFEHRGALVSVAAHLALLMCLVSGVGHYTRVEPYRLPGTAKGDVLLTYYSPGSIQPSKAKTPFVKPERTISVSPLADNRSAPQQNPAQAQKADAGEGAAQQSGLGQGDITIALESYFPHPNPDLSSLPHGTKGDVILDALIDEQGKITKLTLIQGLGSPIDETVIDTVRQWLYTPAKRNGIPVASEQELHFHYERR